MSDPAKLLADAIRSCDASTVAGVLAQYPELTPRLNEALPGEAFGGTPLLRALGCANRDLIDVLLNAGADINQRSHWWAGSFGVLDDDHGLAPFLIERGATVDAHAASRLGMIDRLRELIAGNPALVHARGGDGQTPLHVASSVEIADLLLAHGADIDARDVDHESTPAQYLLRARPDVARHLLARGCTPDLFMLCALGDLEGVRRLLDAQPDAIGQAVTDDCFPMTDPRAGGTIYIWVLGRNKTPHLIAREFGHEPVFDLLMARSSDTLRLAQACRLGDESLVRALLAGRSNAALNLSAAERRAIVDAAQDNNTRAVRLMLEAGWPPDARGAHGGTALHFAAWHGNVEMTQLLLARAAPLEARDQAFGTAPLGWALHGSRHGESCRTGDYAGVVDTLIAAGAKTPAATGDLDASDAVRAVLKRQGRG